MRLTQTRLQSGKPEQIPVDQLYRMNKQQIMDELQKSYVKTQSIPLNVDPDDVYMHTIPITKFLVLFKKTFDYKTTITEYLK